MLAKQKKGKKQRDRQKLKKGWGSALPAEHSALSAGLSLLLPCWPCDFEFPAIQQANPSKREECGTDTSA